MQKLLFALLFTAASSGLFAQSIDDIKDLISKGQWDKAKTSVDAFLTKEKNAAKWEGWFYKGVIYNEIAKNDQFKSLAPEGRMEALAAFKKYYELDPKAIQATLEQHVRLFDIYSGYFDLAAQQFNNKQYDEAYKNFKNAYTAEEYIASKGLEYNNFKFPAFDTTLIQNIALSAFMAKKEDEAAVYYQKIADQKIAGKGNNDVYQFLVDYYNKKKDMANREIYLQLGRELYPEDDFWYQTELADVDEKDKKALFAKYEELGAKYLGKHVLSYNYTVELFNYLYTGDKKPDDYKAGQQKLEAAAKKSLRAKKDYTEANVIISRHFYNVSYDLQDELKLIKGNTPADQKKKSDMKAAIIAKFDEMIPYAQAAYDRYNSRGCMRASEKGNFKMVSDLLASAYEYKGIKDKAEEYRKKMETIEQIQNLSTGDTKKLKIGMSKAEVKSLLCEPPNVVKSTRADGTTELWSYDGYKLQLYFDESGKLIEITEVK